MAKVKPPEKFTFEKPEQWSQWALRFNRFRTVTKLDKEDETLQVDSLLYIMGEEAEVIFRSMTIKRQDGTISILTDDEKKKFDTVMKAFTQYFQPRINHLDHQIEFQRRNQKTDESIEVYIRCLYEMSEYCNFPNREDMIKNRIVTGVKNRQLERELRLKGDELTLQMAVSMARNWEEVEKHITQQEPQQVDLVKKKYTRPPSRGRGQGKRFQTGAGNSYKPDPGNQQKCGRCGLKHSKETKCPAQGKQCMKCKRFNHFRAVCRSSKVQGELTSREEREEDTPEFFLGTVRCGTDRPWTISLPICNKDVSMKIDSGADVTVITKKTYETMIKPPILKPVKETLRSLSEKIQCYGRFEASTELNGKEYHFPVYVIDKGSNLLSRSVSQAMDIIQYNKVDEVKIDSGVFQDVGLLKTEPVEIKLKANSVPYNVPVARRISLPLIPLVEKELRRMEDNGIITKVTKPTEWCAPIVATLKKTGDVRLCVDLRKLNQCVEKERYIIPAIEDIIANLNGSVKYSSLDAAGAYWQLPLSEKSRDLTTFITPQGRYHFNRLPYGITSASEIYQRKMMEILGGMNGVEIYQDDVIVHGKTEDEHDKRLEKVIKIIKDSGLRLNKKKSLFGQSSLKFLGHYISKDGVRPDPDKISAVLNMEPPTDISSLRRFRGMVNHLGQYIPELSTDMKPINDLSKKDIVWNWGPDQQTAFESIKKKITRTPCLAYYDVKLPTVVKADASSYGIGGAIWQKHGERLLPVAFCSRVLSDTERRYAQIEKELLACVWVCNKFSRYLHGRPDFILETDHKPLIPLISQKDLTQVPVRCQRLLMNMMRFNPKPKYVRGTSLVVADTLSREPSKMETEEHNLEEDIDMYVSQVTKQWPASVDLQDRIKDHTRRDPVLNQAISYTTLGWPKYAKDVPESLKYLYEVKAHLSVVEGLLVYNDRIVIPQELQEEMLARIHDGHPGIVKSKERAKEAVWWKGISKQITSMVQGCEFCQSKRPKQKKEPMISTVFPERPWQHIGTDLCDFESRKYLVIMDYFSRYLEITPIVSSSAKAVIPKFKAIFARWGIPEEVTSDNGPPYSSTEFANFANEYGFKITTSSPGFPQANGLAEKGVQIAKKILSQTDPFIALMTYRDTAISATGLSPNEIVLGRKVRTRLPCLDKKLQLKPGLTQNITFRDKQVKASYQENYNRRHGVMPLPTLDSGDRVRIKLDSDKSWDTKATVQQQEETPRSYTVKTDTGSVIRRNRRHLQLTPGKESQTKSEETPSVQHESQTSKDLPVTPATPKTSLRRSGREPKPVKRLIEDM